MDQNMVLRTELICIFITLCFPVVFSWPHRGSYRPKRSQNLRIRCGERIDFSWECYCDRPSVLLTIKNAKEVSGAYLICGVDQELVILAKTPHYGPVRSKHEQAYGRLVQQEEPRTFLSNNKHFEARLGTERNEGNRDYRRKNNLFEGSGNLEPHDTETSDIDNLRSKGYHKTFSSGGKESMGSNGFENFDKYTSGGRREVEAANDQFKNDDIQKQYFPFSRRERSIDLQTVEILCDQDIYDIWYCYCQQNNILMTLPSSDTYRLSCESNQLLTLRYKMMPYYQPTQPPFDRKHGLENPRYPDLRKNVLDTGHQNPFEVNEQNKAKLWNRVEPNSHYESPQPLSMLSQHSSAETSTDDDDMISQEKLDTDLQEAMSRLVQKPDTTPTTNSGLRQVTTTFKNDFKLGGRTTRLMSRITTHESNKDNGGQNAYSDNNANNYNSKYISNYEDYIMDKTQSNIENKAQEAEMTDSKQDDSINRTSNEFQYYTKALNAVTNISDSDEDKNQNADVNIIYNDDNDGSLTDTDKQEQEESDSSVNINREVQSSVTTIEMDTVGKSTRSNGTETTLNNESSESIEPVPEIVEVNKAPCSFYEKDLQVGEGVSISISCKMVCSKKNVLKRVCFGK